jgi:hypothetical protein
MNGEGARAITYQRVAELADQLALVEKVRLIEHLSTTLRQSLEMGSDQPTDWHAFIERMAGSLAATPIERPAQPPLETREALG